MYHVALELTQEQVKQLRLQAVRQSQTVKSFITALVVEAIESGSGIQIRKQKQKEANKK